MGWGEFSVDKDRKYSALHMKMFRMDGNPDGTHDGVWQHTVPFPEMFKKPDPPTGPLDKAEGPIEAIKVRANTKAIWTFGDESSITAVGPASLHFVEFTDQSQIFLVAVNAIITNGTKKYKGARGVKTALGSTFIPKGADMQNPPDGKFGAVTIETFRVLLAKDVMKGTEAEMA